MKPLARLIAFAVAGCPPEEMGIGPVFAIPKALKMAGLTLDQIDVIELNEAFAAQALSVIKAGGLDPAQVNVNGGAVALGHPLGCTGAKLTATILRELERRNARYGLVTMCIGGGMGAAGNFRTGRLEHLRTNTHCPVRSREKESELSKAFLRRFSMASPTVSQTLNRGGAFLIPRRRPKTFLLPRISPTTSA